MCRPVEKGIKLTPKIRQVRALRQKAGWSESITMEKIRLNGNSRLFLTLKCRFLYVSSPLTW